MRTEIDKRIRHEIQTSFGTLTGYLHSSKAKGGQGEPVVLWPSLFSTAAVQHELITFLAKERDVLAIDPPGHGESRIDKPKHLTMGRCADAALALMNSANFQKVRWIGTSWGGMIGLKLAHSHPERMSHLACLNTPFDNVTSVFDRRRWLPLLCRILGTTKFFADGVASTFYLPATRSNPDQQRAMQAHLETFTQGSKTGLASAAELVFRNKEDFRTLLPKVSIPVLVIAGIHDEMYKLDAQQSAAGMLADGTFKAVNSAHIAAVDATVDVFAELKNSWSQLGSKPPIPSSSLLSL